MKLLLLSIVCCLLFLQTIESKVSREEQKMRYMGNGVIPNPWWKWKHGFFGSCKNRCGESFVHQCSCNSHCAEEGTCCPDVPTTCPDLMWTLEWLYSPEVAAEKATSKYPNSPLSCAGKCEQKAKACSCSENCDQWTYWCCDDFEEFCPQYADAPKYGDQWNKK